MEDICRFQTIWETACLSMCQCDGGFEEWEGGIQWQTGQWPHSSVMNPAERGLRPGKQPLNHIQCVYMHFCNQVIVSFALPLFFSKSCEWDFWFSQLGDNIKRNLGNTAWVLLKKYDFLVLLLLFQFQFKCGFDICPPAWQRVAVHPWVQKN